MSARQRVQEYLRQFNLLRDTGGTVHNVHTDPEAEATSLTAADLQAVLTEPDSEGLQAARKVARWHLGDPDWANLLIGAYLQPGPALERLRADKEAL